MCISPLPWIAGFAEGVAEREAVRGWLAQLEPEAPCERCAASRVLMPHCCVVCRQRLCVACSGAGTHVVTPLVRCVDCRAHAAGEGSLISSPRRSAKQRQLQVLLGGALQQATRGGTMAVAWRGLKVLGQFGEEARRQVLPLGVESLSHFAVWAVLVRDPGLDTSTVRTYLSGVSRWHEQTREVLAGMPGGRLQNPTKHASHHRLMNSLEKLYKKESSAKDPFTAKQLFAIATKGFDLDTMGGRRDRLNFMLLLLGPMRPAVLSSIVVRYEARRVRGGALEVVFLPGSEVYLEKGDIVVAIKPNTDKNVTAKNPRLAHIPGDQRILGFCPGPILLDYLLVARPPTGGYLTAASTYPLQPWEQLLRTQVGPGDYRADRFNANAYTASCQMVKRSFLRAFPGEAGVLAQYGGGSPRKSLAEVLWAAGFEKRIIRDLGGWALPKSESVDLYFKTRPHQRLDVLTKLTGALRERGELDAREEPDRDLTEGELRAHAQAVWEAQEQGMPEGGSPEDFPATEQHVWGEVCPDPARCILCGGARYQGSWAAEYQSGDSSDDDYVRTEGFGRRCQPRGAGGPEGSGRRR